MFRVYNTEDGKRIQTWKDPTNDNTGSLIKIDIDASGRYLATSCSNKCVYLWDMKKPEYIASLRGHAQVVTDLKFSHDARRLYTIAGDRYRRCGCLNSFCIQLEILAVLLCGN